MIRKTYDGVYFKALDDSTGEFEAVVSVFGNVDLQGDRTMPGAFSKSLDQWRDSGDPIPVIWSHDWGNPDAHIGYVNPQDAYEVLAEGEKSAGEITGGLFVKGHLDVDKPFAKQVYDLLKERRIREWSFAYDVVDEERNSKDHANELNEVSLFEVGPTLKGANPATTTLGVKSLLDDAAETERGLKKITWALHVDQDTGLKLLKDWVTEDHDAHEKLNAGALRDHLEIEHGISPESMVGVSQADLKVQHGGLHSADEGGGPGKDDDSADEKATMTCPQCGATMQRGGTCPSCGYVDDSEYASDDVDASKAIDDGPFADGEIIEAEKAAYAYDEGVKAGRALSTERETAIRAAIDALTAILPVTGEESAASEEDIQKSAEADQAKAEIEEYRRKLDLLNM